MLMLDKDEQGSIDFSEFVKVALDRKNLESKEKLEAVFK